MLYLELPNVQPTTAKKKVSVTSTERHKSVGAPREQPHQLPHQRATPSVHSSSEPTTMPANVPQQVEAKSSKKSQNSPLDVEKL